MRQRDLDYWSLTEMMMVMMVAMMIMIMMLMMVMMVVMMMDGDDDGGSAGGGGDSWFQGLLFDLDWLLMIIAWLFKSSFIDY